MHFILHYSLYNESMPAISVNHLKKYYKVAKKQPGLAGSFKSLIIRNYETVKAVDDITFEIEEGELVGFIGPNGAGKTTTLKTLSGLLYPTSGTVNVLGYKPYKRDHHYLKKLSFVSGQKIQLWWDLPPMETYLLNKAIYEIPDKKFHETLHDLIDLLDVRDLMNKQVKKLSLGQRMKCELIASMLHTPKVVYLDEPTIGLDVVMQQKIRDFIKEYNQKYNATILLTSHYMQDVQELCKRVIIIDHGKLVYDGLLASITKQFETKKTIKITFDKKINSQDLKQCGSILKSENPYFELEVPKEKIPETTQYLLKHFTTTDLSIADTPIEDIIRSIFTSQDHE